MYWGDALMAAELFDVRPGLHVAVSASGIGGSDDAITLATFGARGLELAGDGEGGVHGVTLGATTFVVAPCERPERPGAGEPERAMVAPMVAALALHAVLMGTRIGSADSALLALDGSSTRPPIAVPMVSDVEIAVAAAPSGTSAPMATTNEPAGAPDAAPRRRAGGRRATGTARPDALALLGGVAARLGAPSNGPAYDAAAALGAPVVDVPTNELFTHGFGTTCGAPPECAHSAIAYGSGVLSGIRIGQPVDGDLAPRDEGEAPSAGRCGEPGARCAARLRVCGAAPQGCSWTVVGTLSRDAVRRAVRAHHNELSYCFENELRGRPDLEGTVRSTFVISPSGVVSTATATSDALPAVATCVQRVLSRITFPASELPTAVTYPFAFEVAVN